MTDILTGLAIGAGLGASAAIGALALALYCTRLCPVCDHVLTKSVEHCPYCMYEF